MYIVLEGLPGAGKTTLQKSISGVYKISEIHFKYKQTDDYIMNDIYKAQKARDILNKESRQVVVADRDYTSYLAYSYGLSKLKNDNNIFKNDWAKVADLFQEKKLIEPDLYLYLNIPPLDSILRRSNKSNEWGDTKFTNYVNEYYENIFSKKPNVVTLNLNTNNIN